MTNPQLKIPSDPNAELYFDANRLVVDFRTREGKAAPREMASKVLRLVVLCYGWVIEDKFFSVGETVTAGPGRKNTLRIPTRDLPDQHPLVQHMADGSIQLTLNQHFSGIIEQDGKLQTLADVAGKASGALQIVTLKRGSRGVIEHGNVRIYFEEIPEPRKALPPALWKMLDDPHFRRWLLVSLALHLMILLVMKILPAPTEEVTLEEQTPAIKKMVIDSKRFAKFTPPKKVALGGLRRGAVGMEGEGARAPGPEGRRGRGVPGRGRAVTGKDIGRQGVLSFFSKGKSGVLQDLIGGSAIPGSVESQFNQRARYGLPGERDLREGKGLRGTGTGGGGLSTSIGQGLGTKGRGGGAKGPGLADFGTGRADVAVSASIDDEEVFIMGNIPKEVIARIINDHIGQIRFCYERQLQRQPELRGKIVADFIIGLEGRVTSTKVKRSTMGNSTVEQCVMNVIRRIPFPKPGGGVVEVIYPFLFRVAG